MLDTLPFELLSNIYQSLPTAQTVLHLSLTCRYLNDFTSKEGWKVFLQNRFPSLPKPPESHDPKNAFDAAHALTTLSRNWDRKAFIARYLDPTGKITSLNTGVSVTQWHRPRGQTMGYQPSIDSYEEWTGGDWTSRKQVLAWSAGTDIILRVKNPGHRTPNPTAAYSTGRNPYLDDYNQSTEWFTYRNPHGWEGRDDITSMKLFKPYQHHDRFDYTIAYGTANTDLSLLRVQSAHSRYGNKPRVSKQQYFTNRCSILSLDISSSKTPFLAASLSDANLALYPIQDDVEHGSGNNTTPIKPLSVVSATALHESTCRPWSTNFLSPDKVAIGVGPSVEPIRIYEVTPTGITPEPLRTFSVDDPKTAKSMSVYPIKPLPVDSQASHAPGQVFLSGCYDGKVRLHDLRSPSIYESMYFDPTNDAAIYSLATQGRERLVAGGSQHSMLKVFDLRVAGGRMYHYLDSQGNTHSPTSAKGGIHTGWSVYLNPRQDSRSRNTSPVYSLSIPNPSSPTLFAGVENAVMQFDFTSIHDKHPDPIFNSTIERLPSTDEIDVKSSWNRKGGVLNLGAYEQASREGGIGMKLHVQRGVGKYGSAKAIEGWDERWKDPGDDDLRSDRSLSNRGQGRYGRGRGRGRARAAGWRGR